MVKREKKEWNPKFKNYMQFIVTHTNYLGMPEVYKKDGSIRWVVTGKSEIGKKRLEWWKIKAKEYNIPIEGKWISKVAKTIHPTKVKICQTCGKELNIAYVYPRKNFIKKLNKIPKLKNKFKYEEFECIQSIVEKLIRNLGEDAYAHLQSIFHIPESLEKSINSYIKYIETNYVEKESKLLSPGAMSNAPDRLDGFHTYNICCRGLEDTGRHAENLSRYNEDRRAYEHWSDGDWKVASWLMKKSKGICKHCKKVGEITADHIGPISLGFAHLPEFQPLCNSCNSAKNNRMTFEDVNKLIELENNGKIVVSWHSFSIWNKLKVKVKDDEDARKLSKLMRISHHHFLEFFYLISAAGHKDFLVYYLNPKYAYQEYIEFINLNSSTFEHDGVISKEGTKTQYYNNAARYLRIAFESLEKYHLKQNRKLENLDCPEYYSKVSEILNRLQNLDRDQTLNKAIENAIQEKNKNEKDKKMKKVIDLLEINNKGIYNSIRVDVDKALEIIATCLERIW